ncbi:Zinc-finger homeodomain protein 3 [Sesamum angolense]|uniref:Zinc-finger homeodomain protein 3 n=1 Tax=Sesamum angolense TaxID=2727404 RepID=A0AAE2BQW2_9LAMI|nr:Zinc-finger homeodomain protein 3 [Sesamum angolense]
MQLPSVGTPQMVVENSWPAGKREPLKPSNALHAAATGTSIEKYTFIIVISPPLPLSSTVLMIMLPHSVVLKKRKKKSSNSINYGVAADHHHHHQFLTTSAALIKPSVEGVSSELVKKRFRTKFSQEQKEKMLGFAEKCEWKLQKVDDSEVRSFCQEIGIKRKVLKVWMHNNKYKLCQQIQNINNNNNNN